MSEQLQLAVTTELYGSGRAQRGEPRYLALSERCLLARQLIAEYVRCEIEHAARSGARSLALAYLMAENPCLAQPPDELYNCEVERALALSAFAEGRYMLLVDGEPVAGLDTQLTLTSLSRVSFIRLMPMVGG